MSDEDKNKEVDETNESNKNDITNANPTPDLTAGTNSTLAAN